MQKFWISVGVVVVSVSMLFGGNAQAAALQFGDIVVSDDQTNRVWLVDPTDTATPQVISSGDMLFAVGHVAVDTGGRLFVAEAGTAGRGILQIDPMTGAQTRLAEFTSGAPTGLAIEADGSFIVTDSFLDTIYRVSSDGSTITEITTTGTNYLSGNRPWGVAVDPTSGNLIVAVVDTDSIVEIDAITGDQTLLTSDGDIDNPRDVAVAGDGTIFIATETDTHPSLTGGQIVKWDGVNQTVLAVTPSPGALFGVDLEPGGDVLGAGPGSFDDTIQGKVVRVGPDGGSTTLLPDSFFSNFKPVGVAVFIPEPATGLLLSLAMVGWFCRRHG